MATGVAQTAAAPTWWRIVRGTWRGTAQVARIINEEARLTYGKTRVRVTKTFRAWKSERNFSADDMPEVDEVPFKRRRRFRTQFLCYSCKRKYSSAVGLNKHFLRVHASEEVKAQSTPHRIRGLDGTTDKVRVAPAKTATASGTATTAAAGSTMDSSIAQAMKNAWQKMAEARPKKLSEIRNDMVGLEQALAGHAGEAIDQYRAHLIRDGFNPVAVQKLTRAKEKLEEAGREFSGVIAKIEEEYAAEIAAARRRKGVARPSDDTLAS